MILTSLSNVSISSPINDNLADNIRAVFRKLFIQSDDAYTYDLGHFCDLTVKTIGGDWGESDQSENRSKVICIRGADITVELLEKCAVPWTVDGEYMENAYKLHIVNHKRAVSLLVPRSYDGNCFQVV